MKIALSGTGGFIGGNVKNYFIELGYEVVSLSRADLYGSIEALAEKVSGSQVVVHLAGTPILGRWTKKYREDIYSSRIVTTRNLVEAFSQASKKPELFICASAVGIYPSEGIHSESTQEFASDFLGKVCADWEMEAAKALSFMRVLHFRFGVVLHNQGGAFPLMALPFRFFAGGKIATGTQSMSWIHLDDVLEIFRFAVENSNLNGAVNIVSPHPITNLEFTHMLATIMRKPAFFAVPQWALQLLFGQGAQILTKGQAATPEKLLSLGFKFKFSHIQQAISNLLAK